MAVIDPPAAGGPGPDDAGPAIRSSRPTPPGTAGVVATAAAAAPQWGADRGAGGRARWRPASWSSKALTTATTVLLQRRRGGGQAAQARAPAASASRARSSPAPSSAPATAPTSPSPINGVEVPVAPRRRPARAVQAERAGRARGPLGRRRPAPVRQRPDAGQARRHLHGQERRPAEAGGRGRQGAAQTTTTTPAGSGRRRRRREPRPGHGRGRARPRRLARARCVTLAVGLVRRRPDLVRLGRVYTVARARSPPCWRSSPWSAP